jgi:hypothetical protein
MFDLGAKLGLGSKQFVFFGEFCMMLGQVSYPRLGIGILINLFRL